METMNNIIKNWPIFLVAISSTVAAIATLFMGTQDAKQKDNIENLGKTNFELGIETKKLSKLNNDISTKIEQITKANKETSDENLILTKHSNQLIEKADALTKETQKLITKINERAANEAAENLTTGELRMIFKPKFTNAVSVKIASNTAINTIESMKRGAKMFVFGKTDPLSINFDNDKMLISIKVIDLQGKLIAEIENNNWRPNRNFTGKFNYDDTGFEVMDNEGNIALSVDIIGNNQIHVQGIFPLKSEGIIILAGRAMSTIPIKSKRAELDIYQNYHMEYDSYLSNAIENISITQLFEYTGKNWLHKRKATN